MTSPVSQHSDANLALQKSRYEQNVNKVKKRKHVLLPNQGYFQAKQKGEPKIIDKSISQNNHEPPVQPWDGPTFYESPT